MLMSALTTTWYNINTFSGKGSERGELRAPEPNKPGKVDGISRTKAYSIPKLCHAMFCAEAKESTNDGEFYLLSRPPQFLIYRCSGTITTSSFVPRLKTYPQHALVLRAQYCLQHSTSS